MGEITMDELCFSACNIGNDYRPTRVVVCTSDTSETVMKIGVAYFFWLLNNKLSGEAV